jgi:DNA polymerase-3 subunit beta
MKVSTLQSTLHQPLSLLSRYVSSRPALPVLANILVETQTDTLVLSATNLDVTIKAHLPATIEEPGVTTIPARLLNEVIGMLPSGQVSLATRDTICVIQSDNTSSDLNTIPPQDFPTLPSFSPDQALKLPLKVLRDVAEKVLFAAATDESRPVLTNLLLKPQDGKIALVATDGFRLSEVIQPAGDYTLTADKQLLLPARLISEMLRLSDGQQQELFIDLTSQANQIGMRVGQVECFSKLVDATYPPYLRIIPTDFTTTVEAQQEELLQAIKIASVFTKDSGALIKLQIQPLASSVIVSAQSSSLGQNQSTVTVKGSGEDQFIAFNARYLLDALNAFGPGPITLSLKGESAPMMLTRADQPSFRHIIMPIKVDS